MVVVHMRRDHKKQSTSCLRFIGSCVLVVFKNGIQKDDDDDDNDKDEDPRRKPISKQRLEQ